MHQAVAACRASLTLVHKWRANMGHDQEAPMPNTQFRISTFGESTDETTITQPNNVTTLNQDSTEQEEQCLETIPSNGFAEEIEVYFDTIDGKRDLTCSAFDGLRGVEIALSAIRETIE